MLLVDSDMKIPLVVNLVLVDAAPQPTVFALVDFKTSTGSAVGVAHLYANQLNTSVNRMDGFQLLPTGIDPTVGLIGYADRAYFKTSAAEYYMLSWDSDYLSVTVQGPSSSYGDIHVTPDDIFVPKQGSAPSATRWFGQ